jgi:hypothetical protein
MCFALDATEAFISHIAYRISHIAYRISHIAYTIGADHEVVVVVILGGSWCLEEFRASS